jgi:hypothetical protein
MAQSLETLRSNNVTSIHGRRLGLQQDETLAGPKEMKLAIEDINSTVVTTALAYGMTRVQTTGSSQGPTQHFLPAPIAGVRKYIAMHTTSTGSQQFLSTANGASILAASDGTTKSLLNFRGPGGSVELMGLTSAVWAVIGGMNVGSTDVVANVTYTTSTA